MQTLEINPDGIYPLQSLAEIVGVPLSKIRREVTAGRLAATSRCGQVFVTGDDALKWLTGKSDKGAKS